MKEPVWLLRVEIEILVYFYGDDFMLNYSVFSNKRTLATVQRYVEKLHDGCFIAVNAIIEFEGFSSKLTADFSEEIPTDCDGTKTLYLVFRKNTINGKLIQSRIFILDWNHVESWTDKQKELAKRYLNLNYVDDLENVDGVCVYNQDEYEVKKNRLCMKSLKPQIMHKGLTSMDGVLSNFKDKAILDLDYKDFPNVKSWANAFTGDIATIHCGKIDFSNVESFAEMFRLPRMERIDFGDLELDSLKTANAMFKGCSRLRYANLHYWTYMKRLKNLNRMFDGCSNLRFVSFSGWELPEYTTTTNMFRGCNNLREIHMIEASDVTINKICEALKEQNIAYRIINGLNYDEKDVPFKGVTILTFKKPFHGHVSWRVYENVTLSDICSSGLRTQRVISLLNSVDSHTHILVNGEDELQFAIIKKIIEFQHPDHVHYYTPQNHEKFKDALVVNTCKELKWHLSI